MNNKELLEKIYAAKLLTTQEVFDENINAYRQKAAAKLRAQDELIELCQELRVSVRQSTVLIMVNGDKALEFVEGAKKFDCFTINPEEFYEKLIDQISTDVYLNKNSNAGLFDVTSAYLEDMAMDIGILEYPSLIFKNEYIKQLSSKADAVQVIKEAINEQVGVEFVGLYMVHQITNQIIDKKFDGKVFPAVGVIKDMKLLQDLGKLDTLGIRTFLVNSGKVKKEEKVGAIALLKEITEENVQETLLKIKQSL
jgi:hypothetical protein